ncbi:hypothetical protein BH20ACT23_BH20ACT23_23200 [soil metagenome]
MVRTVPPQLLMDGNRILRPRDAKDIYVNPRAEFASMAHTGALRKVATGYFVAPSDSETLNPEWRPTLEGVAIGIGRRDYGTKGSALMGISAARRHGVVPRAAGVGIIAVPKQRPRLRTKFGEIVFVTRKVDRLDLVRTRSDVTEGWITSREQTILDLADRPTLGSVSAGSASEAITALAGRVDWMLVREVAHDQRKHAALARACWLAAAVLADPPEPPPFRRLVPAAGLRPAAPVPADRYGIAA